jgi:DNA-directed RNA polymerase subunit RPC12/RpoP
MICFTCNLEVNDNFFEENDNVCPDCGTWFLKKSKIPTECNHEIGYANNYHLQNITWAEHISICPGQKIYSASMYVDVSGEICTTYKYPHQYKEESPCLYDGIRYVGKNTK